MLLLESLHRQCCNEVQFTSPYLFGNDEFFVFVCNPTLERSMPVVRIQSRKMLHFPTLTSLTATPSITSNAISNGSFSCEETSQIPGF